MVKSVFSGKAQNDGDPYRHEDDLRQTADRQNTAFSENPENSHSDSKDCFDTFFDIGTSETSILDNDNDTDHPLRELPREERLSHALSVIEKNWSELEEIWPVIQHHPATVKKIKKLWRKLKGEGTEPQEISSDFKLVLDELSSDPAFTPLELENDTFEQIIHAGIAANVDSEKQFANETDLRSEESNFDQILEIGDDFIGKDENTISETVVDNLVFDDYNPVNAATESNATEYSSLIDDNDNFDIDEYLKSINENISENEPDQDFSHSLSTRAETSREKSAPQNTNPDGLPTKMAPTIENQAINTKTNHKIIWTMFLLGLTITVFIFLLRAPLTENEHPPAQAANPGKNNPSTLDIITPGPVQRSSKTDGAKTTAQNHIPSWSGDRTWQNYKRILIARDNIISRTPVKKSKQTISPSVKTISGRIPHKTLDTTASQSANIYIVTKGDTLWDIAERFSGNPFLYIDIAKNNNIKNPNLIIPGNSIRLIKIDTK